MQILQFCRAAVPLGGVQPEDQPGRRRVRHDGPPYSFLFQFVYVGIVLGLFLHFFIMSYVKPKKKSSKKTA